MANLSDKFSQYGLSLATAQVEYLLNSNTDTSGTNTAAFAYGSAGQSIVNISDSGNWVTKRVQSIVAMVPQDRITLEVSEDGNEWVDAVQRFPAMESGSNKYGCRVIQVSASSNQLDVQFGGNGANGTEAWSVYNTWKWRVRVTRGNLAAGFGEATSTTAGLTYKNRWQRKNLSPGVSTTGEVTGLKFNGLVAGKTYRYSGLLMCDLGAARSFMAMQVRDGSTVLQSGEYYKESLKGTLYPESELVVLESLTIPFSIVFTATSTNVNLNVTSIANFTLGTNSYAIIEELNNYETEATAFT